uniref:Prenylcysteine lyase domain-containing protein n=1 Tax=Arcella intermedia TaxID=1963864 RepID=A0A6B2L480_9EUKA
MKQSEHSHNLDIQVTLFEKNQFLGGRLQYVVFNGSLYEVGGDSWFDKNYHVESFVNQFGIERANCEAGNVGVWNGKEFLFQETSNQWRDMLVGLWKYGLSPLRLNDILLDVTAKFYKQYEKDFGTWESIEEWAQRLDLNNVLNVSLEEYLSKDLSQDFLNEIIYGITKVIYQQEPENIHALSGLIAFIGATAETGSLYSAKEGNRKIVENLVEYANPTLRLGWKVKSIKKTPSDTYIIISTDGDEIVTEIFDYVILASPYETSRITFEGIPTPPPINYVNVVVTLVNAKLSSSYFGDPTYLPNNIFISKDSNNVPWTIFSRRSANSTIYKFFSPTKLDLSVYFEEVYEKVEKIFAAYPVMPPKSQYAPIILAPNFYYPSAFDQVISCMEGAATSSHNVVELLVQSLLKNAGKTEL